MEGNFIAWRERSVLFFENLGLSEYWASFWQSVATLTLILIGAWILDVIATILMRHIVTNFVEKTKNNWDDIFLENKVFAKLSHYLPGIAMLILYPLISKNSFRVFIENIMETYFVLVTLLLVNALINAMSRIYASIKGDKAKEIKIYLQILKVILFSLGGIYIISIFANKNFWDFLTGLGAMLTIILIVYKDTILGFVAGIQLSANDMLKVGDWVVIPQSNADGTVIDISLNTVKIQNWDKTITTVPTYKLISESFTNWKGMEQSGGRRIKRSIFIDMDSIRFLTKTEIAEFKRFALLQAYVKEKEAQIEELNKGIDGQVNQRRLTNIGTFRIYVENYLKELGIANMEMTFLVRQLQSTEKGLPIEIYLFSKEKTWAKYEAIQADIFDHIFAMLPEFGLEIFQSPTSRSFNGLKEQK